MLPFFFQVYIPNNERYGILALQRFGIMGIRNIFANDMQAFFKGRHPNYGIHFDPIVHPSQVNELAAGGVVKKLTFRQFKIPTDLCDAIGYQFSEKDAYVEYSIVARRRGTLAPIRSILQNLSKNKDKKPYVQKPTGFEGSNVLLEVTLNGRRRTIDVSQLSKIRSQYDVTDELSFGDNGHPTYESLKDVTKEVVADIWASIKGAANVR
jgi:hypothetical protein